MLFVGIDVGDFEGEDVGEVVGLPVGIGVVGTCEGLDICGWGMLTVNIATLLVTIPAAFDATTV